MLYQISALRRAEYSAITANVVLKSQSFATHESFLGHYFRLFLRAIIRSFVLSSNRAKSSNVENLHMCSLNITLTTNALFICHLF